MKNRLSKTLLFLLFCTSTVFSQEGILPLKKQLRISYNILAFEVGYEIPLSEKFTVELSAGIGAGSYIKNTPFIEKEFGYSLSFDAFPPLRFKSRFRYLYNRENRVKKGKNITNNSGNYFGFQSLLSTKQNVTDITNPPNTILLNEIHWGIQRSIGDKWLFNVNAGIGFAYDFDTELNKFFPALGLEISYILK